MKICLLLFLAGFALASASPLYDLGQVGGFGEFADDVDQFSVDKPTLEEVKEKLREKFNDFLHKVREALKGGKDIKDEIVNKGKEIKEKFKLLKEQLDKEGKEFFEKLLDHGRDYLKKIFEKLGVNDKQAIDYHVESIMRAEDKDDLIQKLKDRFKEVVKKVKDAIEQGKNLKDGLETLEKIRQKLKDFNIDLGDFGNEYLEQLKDKIKDYWKKLKDKLGVSKREASLDVFAMIKDFKQLINGEFDLERIKAFIEKYVGQNTELTEDLTKFMKENGKDNRDKTHAILRKIIHLMIGEHSEVHSDVFEQIRDFFKDLGIEIRDRFHKFGEWVKEQYQKGLEKSRNRLENIKKIAKEFLQDSKNISRDVAEEALKFFKEYKKDLGVIFDDIEAKVKEILKQD